MVAAIAGAATLASGAISAISSSSAASAQESAANNATNQEQHQFDITQQNLHPFQQSGADALTPLNALTGANGGDPAQMEATLQKIPGYQFTLDQGNRAVQNSAAARGLGNSGAALRGAADYTTGLADSTYGHYVNQLMGIANMGENAAAQVGTASTQVGQQNASNSIGSGNAQAAGTIGTGNGIASGFGGALTLGNSQGVRGLFGDGSSSGAGSPAPGTTYALATGDGLGTNSAFNSGV
jgi:hypothetical protein